MLKERSINGFVLFNLLFLFALFCSLRAYLLLSGNIQGDFPLKEVLAGFSHDALLAVVLTWITFIALYIGKAVYFIFAFSLQLIVVITSYSNLQYVNFFRENLRLFDLEYIRNIGDLWRSTATDLYIHPGEILFLIVPLLVLLAQAIYIIKLRKKRIAFTRALGLHAILFFFSGLFFSGGMLFQNKEKKRAVHQSNYFVWMVRDIPQVHRFFKSSKELRRMEVTFEGEPALAKLDLKSLKSKETTSKNLLLKKRPFSLPDDFIWYDASFPFIKIPQKDAYLMGLLQGKEESTEDASDRKPLKLRNVVFLILEGFRAREIDIFGGNYSITPNFNELASKSIFCNNFYGHTDLTAGAQLSSIASFYDSYKGVNVMRDHAHIELFSLPEILQLFGYRNYWINSWPGDFDNMRIFFKIHGNFRMVDKDLFPKDAEMAGWAYSDEEIMRMAVRTLDRASKPFFAMVLTATNHLPYEVPQNKFILGLETGNYGKYLNTFHYTDYALGYFFKLIRTRKYFKDTIFFIFADTGNPRLKEGEESSPPVYFSHIYHIPLLIYDPQKEEGKVLDEIAHQVDLAPTVLDLLGIEIANHFVGQSLLKERMDPYYLSYHGRGVPRAFYTDRSLLCRYHSDVGDFDLIMDREKMLQTQMSQEKQEMVVSRVETLTTLIDWAILNDRVWDKRLTAFYKSLYEKKSRTEQD